MRDRDGAPDPAEVLWRQLGRTPRGVVDVSVWCPHGAPAVIETRPYLEDGEPFPTTYYLSCPSAVNLVSTVEASGGVERLRWLATNDSGVSAALTSLGEWYAARRRRLAPPGRHCDEGAVLEAGIGGPKDPAVATCVHAYVAALLAVLVNGPELEEAAPGACAGLSGWSGVLQGLLAPVEQADLWCRDGRCVGGPRGTRRAALDVGTNSVRLLVADLGQSGGGRDPRVPAPVVRRARVTRLGEGLVPGGMLSAQAMERTCAAVADYVTEARLLGAESILLIGTSAARTAVNGAEFIAGLVSRFGLAGGVVSGEVEARLAFVGATLEAQGDVVLVDVGGGSTELVRAGDGDELVVSSLELGCVRDTEAFIHSDPPSQEERLRLRAHVAAKLEGELRPADPPRGTPSEAQSKLCDVYAGADTLVAVGGTAATLAALALGLEHYTPDAVHHTLLSREHLARLTEELAAMDCQARAQLPTMQRGRADVIVAGAEILVQIMTSLGYGVVLVSERDLLDGLVVTALAET